METRALKPNHHKTRKRHIRTGILQSEDNGYPYNDYRYFYHQFQPRDSEEINWLNGLYDDKNIGDNPNSFGYQHLVDQGPCGCWSYFRQRENMDWTPHKTALEPENPDDLPDWKGRDPQEDEFIANENAYVWAACTCCMNEDILMDEYMKDDYEQDGRPMWHNVKDLGCCNHMVAEYDKQDPFHWSEDYHSLGCCQSVACYNTLFAMAGIIPILLALFLCRVKSDDLKCGGCNPWAQDSKCNRSVGDKQYQSDQKHLRQYGGGYDNYGYDGYEIDDYQHNALLPSYSKYNNSGDPFGMAM